MCNLFALSRQVTHQNTHRHKLLLTHSHDKIDKIRHFLISSNKHIAQNIIACQTFKYGIKHLYSTCAHIPASILLYTHVRQRAVLNYRIQFLNS